MVLLMAPPIRRSDTSVIYFRKGVPADIQQLAKGQTLAFAIPGDSEEEPEIVATVNVGAEVKVSLRTRDPAIAKLRTGLAAARLELFCDGVRRGPQPLTNKQIMALAGILYREMIASRSRRSARCRLVRIDRRFLPSTESVT
jgi:hypothetical protein